MNELPKIYINKITENIKNYQEEARVTNNQEINFEDILSKDKYVFNHTYRIILNNNDVINDSIIDKNNNKILTLNNSWINISDIKYIDEIKK